MSSNEAPTTRGESNGEGVSSFFRSAKLRTRPARWASVFGLSLAVFPLAIGINGGVAFPIWSSAVIVGYLVMGFARIWDATQSEAGITRERSIAIVALHIGVGLVVVGLLASDDLRTVTRLAASGTGVTFVALGYFWNRRLLQARDALRTDERLRALKHRAAYRVAQLTYGLIVLGILLILVVEPTASAPLVPVLVGVMLVGALSYAVFYGYYETQF